MKKWLLVLLFPSIVSAAPLQFVFNPTTGKLDYVTNVSSLVAGDLPGLTTNFNITNVTSTWTANQAFSSVTVSGNLIANGNIKLGGGVSNTIFFGDNGVGVPGTGGEKLSLFGVPGTLSGSDYSIGVEANFLWYATPSGFKWYVQGNKRMSMDSLGNVVLTSGTLTAQTVVASSGIIKNLLVSRSGTFNQDISSYVIVVTTTPETYDVAISSSGHFSFSGSSPIVSSCGAVPNGVCLNCTDNAGTIQIGGGVPNACTVTFGVPYLSIPGNPTCIVNSNTAAAIAEISSVNNTGFTIGFGATVGNGKAYYACFGVRE